LFKLVLQKESIRQGIFFPVFSLDMPVPLYISQGASHHQHKYLLGCIIKQLDGSLRVTKFHTINNLILMAWHWPICSRNR